MSRNDGKSAEQLVQSALQDLERTHKATWVRLYDSHSAGYGSGGNLIPPQPADYIIATDRAVFLLEVKSSNRFKSLKECTLRELFKECQILGARLWHRAGQKAICVFYSLETRKFEVWDMRDILPAYLAPPRKRKLTAAPITVCSPDALCDILYNVI